MNVFLLFQKTIALISLLSLCQQTTPPIYSPDGRFEIRTSTKEEADSNTRSEYILIDKTNRKTIPLVNCISHDLPFPSYYWDKNSRYLVYEECVDERSRKIKILDLITLKNLFQTEGLVGNDRNREQFDEDAEVLIYFNTSEAIDHNIPPLYLLDVKTFKKQKLFEFSTPADLEYPDIKMDKAKREIVMMYPDQNGKQIIEKLNY